MSDLISRSALLKRLEEWNTSDETDKDLYNFALHRIIEQNTAYSVDKVVEELEERQKEYLAGFCVHNNDEMYGIACGLGDAIKIVKQCGISDDVCELKLEDEESNLYLTRCQQRQLIFEGTPKENGYRYCPYCGKKIKIVGD